MATDLVGHIIYVQEDPPKPRRSKEKSSPYWTPSDVDPVKQRWLHRLGQPNGWKKGNKSDKMRAIRYRRFERSYHRALDISEIYEKILSYVVHEDPIAALHFVRALEFLGCHEALELAFLAVRRDARFTNRIGLGIMRTKMLKGKHCTKCFSIIRSLGINQFTKSPLCQHCFAQNNALITKNEAEIRMRVKGVPVDAIKVLLSPFDDKCPLGVHLRRIKYKGMTFYLYKEVREAIKLSRME